jgi:hypothetical protein
MTHVPVRKDQVFGTPQATEALIEAFNTLIMKGSILVTRQRTGVRVLAQDVSQVIGDAPLGSLDSGGIMWKKVWALYAQAGWAWAYEESTPGVGNPDTFLFY